MEQYEKDTKELHLYSYLQCLCGNADAGGFLLVSGQHGLQVSQIVNF